MDNMDVLIMEKVREKEAYLRDLKRCLAADICPKCGKDIDHQLPELNGTTGYYVTGQLKCKSCSYTHDIGRD